jgi:hypothetical protein
MHDLINLISGDDQWRREKQVIPGDSVGGPRAWIRHQAAHEGGIPDSRRDAPGGRKRLFRRSIPDELDPKEESKSAHIPDHLVPLS